MNTQPLNEQSLMELQGKVIGDVSGAMGLLMAYIGDQAGVYTELERAGACSSNELARRTGLNVRYLHEWLCANAAAGYINYNATEQTFSLSPEQAAIFAHEGEPTCMQGFFQSVLSQFESHEDAVEVFKTGRGRAWSEQTPCCFCGTDRFFRPGYDANLVSNWIPSLAGVEAKLKAGAKVADIGCGHGSSTILMAQSYPNSTIIGIDFHGPSITTAKAKAAAAGLTNVEFHQVAAKDFTHKDFDLACIFDALHDMGDPVGAAKHIKESLKPDGSFMVVEPAAGNKLEDNLHPLGGIYYGFSTTVCIPTSMAQEVGLGLGAQAGQQRLTEVLHAAGFSTVRRANETPTNMVLEAVR
ncbi:class I SAM-dependent methyltransferase [Ferrimonas lipolytica]|uniref:Methyltransferase domain-containing protein n=1 Tax=Ferrimonas lipolytica TaxID=2724191 RepID=A0A6H1UGZ4_9GAMM|nr:methyltransferase domain-containing protein [Ferrimonas lipolytica]QIZ78314.1 methyltransferase domain-containing protein [Ferrimonas lipolytica]